MRHPLSPPPRPPNYWHPTRTCACSPATIIVPWGQRIVAYCDGACLPSPADASRPMPKGGM